MSIVCSICLEELFQSEVIIALDCGHIFHNKCIIKWTEAENGRQTCPTCRKTSKNKLRIFLQVQYNAIAAEAERIQCLMEGFQHKLAHADNIIARKEDKHQKAEKIIKALTVKNQNAEQRLNQYEKSFEKVIKELRLAKLQVAQEKIEAEKLKSMFAAIKSSNNINEELHLDFKDEEMVRFYINNLRSTIKSLQTDLKGQSDDMQYINSVVKDLETNLDESKKNAARGQMIIASLKETMSTDKCSSVNLASTSGIQTGQPMLQEARGASSGRLIPFKGFRLTNPVRGNDSNKRPELKTFKLLLPKKRHQQ